MNSRRDDLGGGPKKKDQLFALTSKGCLIRHRRKLPPGEMGKCGGATQGVQGQIRSDQDPRQENTLLQCGIKCRRMTRDAETLP